MRGVFPAQRRAAQLGSLVMLALACGGVQALAFQDAAMPLATAPAPGATATPLQAGQEVSKASFTNCAKAVWPRASLRKEEEGAVTMGFLIGADSKLIEAKIIKSSGYPLLDRASLHGMSLCTFQAAVRNGVPEQGSAEIQYVWSLEASAKRDFAAEFKEARKGARFGVADSQYDLAMLYLDGKGVERSIPDAMRWLRAAAVQGQRDAQHMLGSLLYRGDSDATEAEAIAWFRRAAEQDHVAGQAALGVALVQTTKTATRCSEAAPWLRKADAQGSASAALMLGICHHCGWGVDVDLVKAAALYERAALGGNNLARKLLGDMYAKGKGVLADPAKAAYWHEAVELDGM